MAATSAYPERVTTRAAQREQTRARIVESAIEAFAEHGFEGSSTRDIASRAGTSQGLLSYHFETKLDLWRAAADRIFSELNETLGSELEANPTDAETARETIKAFVRLNARRPELIHFMVDSGRFDDGRTQYLVEHHLPRWYESVARFSGDGVQAAHLYYALAGASSLIFGIAPECKALTGVDPALDDVIERHADYIARLFVP